jgi:hypothetical protein
MLNIFTILEIVSPAKACNTVVGGVIHIVVRLLHLHRTTTGIKNDSNNSQKESAAVYGVRAIATMTTTKLLSDGAFGRRY